MEHTYPTGTMAEGDCRVCGHSIVLVALGGRLEWRHAVYAGCLHAAPGAAITRSVAR